MPLSEERQTPHTALVSALRTVKNQVFNEGHSGLEPTCSLCQAYISSARLLAEITGTDMPEEVEMWDRRRAALSSSLEAKGD